MHLSTHLVTALAVVSVPTVLGFPGMRKLMAEIRSLDDDDHSTELLGDLITLPDSELTPVGSSIKEILLGGGDPESDEKYKQIPAKNSQKCKEDQCCIWHYITQDMVGFMKGKSGRCTKWARFAVRLGFHDAGTWSKATASQGGGADGSIILSGTEVSRGENRGLEDIIARFGKMHTKYQNQGFNIGMADLIQLGANVGAVICPLGPRVRTYVGRVDSAVPAPDGLLPDVHADAESLIQLFRDKTIGPHGLAALVGAHTTSQQHFVNVTRAGDPQDSTPGVWDVKFYGQTTNPRAPKRVFKFPSDIALSQHPLTKFWWDEFTGRRGQDEWNEDYAREYIRLSLLGVNNINKLTECTKVLPAAVTSFIPGDQGKIDAWLNTTDRTEEAAEIAADLDNGEVVLAPAA
jgi:hypothetical protein